MLKTDLLIPTAELDSFADNGIEMTPPGIYLSCHSEL